MRAEFEAEIKLGEGQPEFYASKGSGFGLKKKKKKVKKKKKKNLIPPSVKDYSNHSPISNNKKKAGGGFNQLLEMGQEDEELKQYHEKLDEIFDMDPQPTEA